MTNCKVHDVDQTNGGQLKVQQSDSINIHDCQIYNYVGLGGGAIDGVWDVNCWYHRNYFSNTYTGGFVKGGSLYNVFEDNVFVNPAVGSAGTSWGFLPGGCTLNTASNPNCNHQSEYTVIRNNIVEGTQRGATSTWGGDYAYIYNNLFVNCAQGDVGLQLRHGSDCRPDACLQHPLRPEHLLPLRVQQHLLRHQWYHASLRLRGQRRGRRVCRELVYGQQQLLQQWAAAHL